MLPKISNRTSPTQGLSVDDDNDDDNNDDNNDDNDDDNDDVLVEADEENELQEPKILQVKQKMDPVLVKSIGVRLQSPSTSTVSRKSTFLQHSTNSIGRAIPAIKPKRTQFANYKPCRSLVWN